MKSNETYLTSFGYIVAAVYTVLETHKFLVFASFKHLQMLLRKLLSDHMTWPSRKLLLFKLK